MVATSLRAAQTVDVAVRTLCAALAGWIALFLFFLFSSLLARYVWGGLWDSALANWAELITVGFVSGLLVGAVLGRLFSRKAWMVAFGAGVS
ncbi:MAG TPA: DUF543 domain-containing protein [Hyphomicrobiales bacterium]|nr:DUF543 domain-containing protein [Hyphomicrobiales bacterium]